MGARVSKLCSGVSVMRECSLCLLNLFSCFVFSKTSHLSFFVAANVANLMANIADSLGWDD